MKSLYLFQVKFYPDGIVKKIKFNGKPYPVKAYQDGKTIRLGNVVKLGTLYSFYPHMDDDKEENLFLIQFNCDFGIVWLQRHST